MLSCLRDRGGGFACGIFELVVCLVFIWMGLLLGVWCFRWVFVAYVRFLGRGLLRILCLFRFVLFGWLLCPCVFVWWFLVLSCLVLGVCFLLVVVFGLIVLFVVVFLVVFGCICLFMFWFEDSD